MFAVALAWYVVSTLASGLSPTPYGIGFLVALTLLGIAYYLSIDSPFDRPFARYLGSTLDVAAISALFVVVPVYQGLDLPQIYAFRNSDIILLLPLVALTTLTLSPWLVLWSGLSAVVCWMAAYVYVLLQMDRRVSWSDMPAVPTRAEYEGLILSPDFVARGNRMTEALVTLLVTAVLALAVARARRVFYAQVAAETEREQERAARAEVRSRLGRFVPAAIAERVLNDPASLEPRVRHAAALFMDITEFTAYAHTRDPGAVIAELNDFLARCADEVAAAGGVVISFTGDGLLATFNTPLDLDAPEAERPARASTARTRARSRRRRGGAGADRLRGRGRVRQPRRHRRGSGRLWQRRLGRAAGLHRLRGHGEPGRTAGRTRQDPGRTAVGGRNLCRNRARSRLVWDAPVARGG